MTAKLKVMTGRFKKMTGKFPLRMINAEGMTEL